MVFNDDISDLRMAGKVQWNLDNIDAVVARLKMEEDEAALAIRESKAISELNKKAASEELFPDEVI